MKKLLGFVFCVLFVGLAGCGSDDPIKPGKDDKGKTKKESATPPIDKLAFLQEHKDLCQLHMQTMTHAVKAYYLNVGEPPKKLDDLVKLPTGVKKERWKGPYIADEIPKDPWGNEYQMSFGKSEENPRKFIVILKSFGPDGKEGGDDDITNQAKEKKAK